MKVLLLTNYFPPEIGSASHLFYDLGEGLVSRGHSVQVLTGFPSYNMERRPAEYRRKVMMKEEEAGMKVLRVGPTHLPASRKVPVVRGLEHLWLGFVYFFWGLWLVEEPDVILLYSPPLTLGMAAWALSRMKGASFVINVQDLFPKSAVDLGVLTNPLFIGFFRRMEKFVYEKARFVTVHSSQNKKAVEERGVSSEKVEVIPNWAPTEEIKPGPRKNEFRKKYDLEKRFVVSFAGVLGYSQDLDVVLEAARSLKNQRNILFLIIGDGPEKKRLKRRREEMQLENVRFLPLQPREKYPATQTASDVCLATLKKEVETPVVPSKILSAMAAGRPVLAAMNLGGDAPRVIKKSGCGWVCPAGDSQCLAEKILKLYTSTELREKMGKAGRRFAEENLSLRVCIRSYEKLFAKKS